MNELDLRKIAEAMNNSCGTNIDLSKIEGWKLTGDKDCELQLVEPNKMKGEKKMKKIVVALSIALFVTCIISCGNKKSSNNYSATYETNSYSETSTNSDNTLLDRVYEAGVEDGKSGGRNSFSGQISDYLMHRSMAYAFKKLNVPQDLESKAAEKYKQGYEEGFIEGRRIMNL